MYIENANKTRTQCVEVRPNPDRVWSGADTSVRNKLVRCGDQVATSSGRRMIKVVAYVLLVTTEKKGVAQIVYIENTNPGRGASKPG